MARSSRSRPLCCIDANQPVPSRRWRGALLPNHARIDIEIIEPDKRPVSAVADHTEIRNVRSVSIREDADATAQMLFDPGHSLDERILAEQFGY
jgi:NAD+ kinase